jgi:hypothetical protein
MVSHGRKLLVLGGQQDTGGKLATKWMRKDLLIYEPTAKAWLPPIKNVFVSSKSYRELAAEHVFINGEQLYIIYRAVCRVPVADPLNPVVFSASDPNMFSVLNGIGS